MGILRAIRNTDSATAGEDCSAKYQNSESDHAYEFYVSRSIIGCDLDFGEQPSLRMGDSAKVGALIPLPIHPTYRVQ